MTMHGFALNCDVDLSWYDRFVPCGIADAGVTTLSEELGRDVTVAEVLPLVEQHLTDAAGVGAVRPDARTTSRARAWSPSPQRPPRTCVSPCSIRSPDPALRHAGRRMAEGCVDNAMSDLVIETSGLRKVYRSGGRRIVAVDGLDLSVPPGGVHGFLGPNGSGKTTTIQMLLGLARPTKGEMRLFGLPGAGPAAPGHRPGRCRRRGAALPRHVLRAQEPHPARALDRRARAPRSTRRSSRSACADRARDDYQGYSLGMKQRLAIAAALLKSPDLLILDEPTNGLDPAGIRGIRDLIRDLGESGVTVLLSSHILAEVQQVCHSVSIVGDGRLLASGRVERPARRERLQDARRGRGPAGRQALPREGRVRRDPRRATRWSSRATRSRSRSRGCWPSKGIYVQELTEIRPTLESFFLKLTGRQPDRPTRATGADDSPDEEEAT